MKALQHKLCNDVLGAPKGVLIEQCHALAIRREQYEDGTHVVVSFWKPSASDLKQLNDGACVALLIQGTTHAPLCVGVVDDERITVSD